VCLAALGLVATLSATAADAPAGAPAPCPQIAQAAPNTWVKLDECMAKDGRSPGSGLAYLASARKFILNGNGSRNAEMLFDPASGSWSELQPGQQTSKLLKESTGCFLAWDPVTEQGYGYIGSDTWGKNLLRFDVAQQAWTNLASRNPPPRNGEAFTRWATLCWLPESGELLLANGAAPYGGSGTWIYNPPSNVWRRLSLGSPLINDRRADLQKVFEQGLDLVAACRNRHYRAESAEAAKVSLEKLAADLAAAITAQSKTLAAAKGGDAYEVQQLTRATAALAEALKVVESEGKKLGSPLNVALLTVLQDTLSETLRSARDELAVEPPPRVNSPLLWNPVARKVVCFGGDGYNRAYADTWTFDPASSRWMQQHPPAGPGPRAGHALVWLPKAKTLLLVGRGYLPNQARGKEGLYETLPFEMWTYDLAADRWALLLHVDNNTGAPPAELCGTGLSAFAAGPDDLVVGLGELGYWVSERKFSTWACRVDTTKPDPDGTAKFSVKPNTVTFFGGPGPCDREPAEESAVAEERLAKLPPNTWTMITTKSSGGVTGYGNWGTCVLDPDTDQLIWWRGGHAGYCGNDVAQYSIRANTWSISYRPSHPLTSEGACSGYPGTDFDGHPWMGMHTYHRCAYDAASRRTVIHSSSGAYLFDAARRSWDKTNFPIAVGNFVSTPHGPLGGGVKRFDATNGWVALTTQGKWPDGFCGFSAAYSYDGKRDRLYCASGKGYGSRKEGEVWSYDCKTTEITELKPKNADKVKFETETARESIYIPGADIVLFLAGGTDWHYAYDVAANEWKSVRLKPKNVEAPGGFIASGLMYDPKRKLVFLLGPAPDLGFQVFALRLDAATAEFAELK
jgi:hypothetical protein